MVTMDNANPTIINDTELPTRRRREPEKETQSTFWDAFKSNLDDLDRFIESGTDSDTEDDDLTYEPIDELEIYDLISTISDPEHPLSLGSLAVVNLKDIHFTPPISPIAEERHQLTRVLVEITPTITHCSLATVIGLGVRVRLEQALPPNFRVDVQIKEGTHSQDTEVNKQLQDKERVAAALENATLFGVITKMLETCA